MKTEVKFLIDTAILEKAKKYAAENGLTISKLLEKYLIELPSIEKRKTIMDLIQELPKCNVPEDADLKKIYYEAMAAKYGL